MFDLSTLSEWDKALSGLEPSKTPTREGEARTMKRDEQGECPFGFHKEARNG